MNRYAVLSAVTVFIATSVSPVSAHKSRELLTPSPRETVLYSFGSGADGAGPDYGVTKRDWH